MALITCHECGKQVSADAKTCPTCGAKVKKPPKSVGLVGIFFVAVFAIPIFMSIFQSEQRATDIPAKTPEQLAQEKINKAKRDAHLQAAGIGAVALKQAMKDPEAFQLTSLVVKSNGTACYDYRAKNSFGAVLPSSAVLTASGKMLTQERNGNAFVITWNKECTRAGGDDIAELVKRLGLL